MTSSISNIHVAVEKPLYAALQELAKEEGLTLSMLTRDLLKEALEMREDQALAQFAAEREQTFDRAQALSHEDVWT